ncbi:MAG: hypothetical protein KDL87_04335, partial [Verrucomicrobiae bacterium]|nr:hypothetical protein [Verrucomicrobiae bacterium]
MLRPHSILGPAAVLLILSVTHGGSAAPATDSLSPKETVFFETHIRPALIEHCYKCHSEEAGKRKGGLWLDRRAGWATGGDNGPAIIP